jgi:hypothetical protein
MGNIMIAKNPLCSITFVTFSLLLLLGHSVKISIPLAFRERANKTLSWRIYVALSRNASAVSWRIYFYGMALLVLFICFLPTIDFKIAQAESLTTTLVGMASNGITATMGHEVYGLAGPAPVNCSDAVYTTARPTLDQQRADWIGATTTALPGAVALRSWFDGPAGTPIVAPYVLTQADGFAITVTPVDLAPGWGFESGSNAAGIPAFDQVQINGSPSGCTMQDNAPKPSAAAGGDFYLNQLSNARGLNGLRFTFSTPVNAFGAFFGDLETSDRGTNAFLRLLDADGKLLADLPIRCGGRKCSL